MRRALQVVFALLALSTATSAVEPQLRTGGFYLCYHNASFFNYLGEGFKVVTFQDFGTDNAEPAAIDFFAWQSLSKSMEAGDRDGLTELRGKKKIIDLPTGIMVQVLSSVGGGGLSHVIGYEVRIQEGEHAKKVVYIPETAILKSTNGLKLPDDPSKRVAVIKERERKIAEQAAQKLQEMPERIGEQLARLHARAMQIKFTNRTRHATTLNARRRLILQGLVRLSNETQNEYNLTSADFAKLLLANHNAKWKCVKSEEDRKAAQEVLQVCGFQSKTDDVIAAALERVKNEMKAARENE